ncbi:MAG: hypothetical protein SVY10_10925 [Thermodesulfobacteriota bacterium]|nr:hypothetical protein [Thermodesulfobacteriota bacterium]
MLTAISLLFLWIMPVAALDIDLQLSGGYDDNTSLSSEPEESWFSRYQSSVFQQFHSETSSLRGGLFFDFSYQDYFSASDNYILEAGGTARLLTAAGHLQPGILYRTTLYRDEENPEDEMMGHDVSLYAEYLVNARLTLGLQQTWSRHDYHNPVEYIEYTSSGSGQGQGNTGGNQVASVIVESRDDNVIETQCQCTVFLNPNLTARATGHYNRLSSSIDTEAYNAKGLIFDLSWVHNDRWETSITGAVRETDFERVSGTPHRSDNTESVRIMVGRYFFSKRKFAVFVEIEYLDNNSSIEDESYHRTVTECGLLFQF